MAVREYIRICKQAGCGQEFLISASSLDADRAIGFSEPEYCPKHRALHARSYSRIACHHYDVKMTRMGEELTRLIERHKKLEGQKAEELSGKIFDPWWLPEAGFGPGGLGRFQRPLRAFLENMNYHPEPKAFQIAEKKDEILAALEEHQVVVLVGTTGSGKSTYVPWLLLTGGMPGGLSKWTKRGPICVTQPRIQATRQVPRFIANKLNGTSLGIGSQIGFSHSKADEYDRRTRLIFKTDGKLINDIVSGAVSEFSIVIIDEAHERSVNIDLILGLLRDQLYLYPHLRIIIASATIDFGSFLGFFYPELKTHLVAFEEEEFLKKYSYFNEEGRFPFIYSEGRRFPITERFWGDAKDDWWKGVNGGQQPSRDKFPNAIAELVQQLCKHLDDLPADRKDEDGHILVFLPGTREIDQTVSEIEACGLPNVVALPLYAQRPLDEQEAALNPDPKKHPKVFGKRRVVVSTNVAETSLTVEGVRYVVDTGYIKESYWNPATEVSELRTVRHSRAGCRQRWGRAGRISSGHAFMLYTKNQFDEMFPSDSTPAIARSSLEQVLLTAKAAGVRTAKGSSSKVLDFHWMPLSNPEDDKRLKEELIRAYDTLQRMDALDKDGDLTRLGLELRGMPAEVDVARIFTEGERYGMGIEVATLLPFLKLEFGLQALLMWDRDWDAYTKLSIRQNHLDLVYGCRDDLELYFKLWSLWELRSDSERRQWEDEGGVSYKNFTENIEGERRKILEAAMDWRKAEKRHVAIEKIDALRALIGSCLQHEIYIPIEDAFEIENGSPRFRAVMDALELESVWEGQDQYEEYDEDVSFDATYSSGTTWRSGVYCRYDRGSTKFEDSSLIEIAPTSICFAAANAGLLVACQRRANFRRPARTKVLGMNMIRLSRDWMEAIQGSKVQRAFLYASLSRDREMTEHVRLKERLFIPWLIPRGRRLKATVREWEKDRGGYLDVHVPIPFESSIAALGIKALHVEGWLRSDGILDQSEILGKEMKVEVIGHSWNKGDPLLLLGPLVSEQHAFRTFAKKYRKGVSIEVEMDKVLEDPLGRNPMFIVREPVSGLKIPMADSDFCGSSHPQAYFGRRFGADERFEVDIEEIYPESEKVFLSRGRQLFNEYAHIANQDFKLIEVIVMRVDELGAYLAIPGTDKASPYVGFARRALWPTGFVPKPNDCVQARFRRLDRHVNIRKMEQRLEDGLPLPSELDLGVELDLRIPPAYMRFQSRHKVGDLISVTVDRPLDNGCLLVSLDEDLKGMIYESELGLDENGRIKSARSYATGKTIDVLISQMINETATVRCSIFRILPLPDDIEPGDIIETRVLLVRSDSQETDRLWVTCSLEDQCRVEVQASAGLLDSPLETGEYIYVRIDKVDARLRLIRGTFDSMSDEAANGDD